MTEAQRSIRLVSHHVPIAKKRHRHGKHGTYNPQKAEESNLRVIFKNQLIREGHLKPLEGPIFASVSIFIPKPKTWSKKRLKLATQIML